MNYNNELLLKEAENEREKIQNMSEGSELHTPQKGDAILNIYL